MSAKVTSEPVDDTLFTELRHPDGSTTQWHGKEPEPGNIPLGRKLSNSAPGGHRDASWQLFRDPRRDYPDLNLVDDVVISGRAAPLGRSAFEGQVAHLPSELGAGVSIGVNCAGNQVLLDENETWKALYVALGFEGWGEAPLVRRERNAELGRPQGKIAMSTGDGLVWDPPNEALPTNEVSEAHFQCSAGLAAAKLGYRGVRKGDWSKFETPLAFGDDAENLSSGGFETVGLTLDGAARVATFEKVRRFLALRALVSSGHTPVAGAQQRFDRLAVYGDHGLPLRDIPGELPGLYAHDVLPHMLDTGAPELNYTVGADGTIVPNTDFVLPDLAFPSPGKVSEAILHLNAYFLNNFGVWDRREFHWRPWDPDRLTWKARIAGGAHWAPAGRQALTAINGVVVSFANHAGQERTAGPPGSGFDFESPALLNPDPNNPYTRRGRKRWEMLRVDFPVAYASTAFQIGHVFVLERSIPQRSGRLVIRPLGEGHVPQIEHPTMGPVPTWAAWSGDFVHLDGWPEPEPFRLIEADYDPDTRTFEATLDTASPRLSAIMERVGVRSRGIV